MRRRGRWLNDRMLLARLLRLLTRLRSIQPQVGRVHAFLLRRSRGLFRRSRLLAGGQPVLALTTIGRRSGKPRTTTLAYVKNGRSYAVGALNLGSDHDSAWCLNLRADPRAWVEVAGNRLTVFAREATGAEAEQLWARFIEQLPQIRHTRRIARRHVPIWVLEPLATETSVEHKKRYAPARHRLT
jgi:deazaflavin-dependent oxidoreductase (nitroreductase family)